MTYLLGGKFAAAIEAARILREMGVAFSVIPSSGEERIPAMPSLERFASGHDIPILRDPAALHGEDITFISVEFDRLIHPARFGGASRFFNIHFSMLPAYRGTMTSFWPIILRERTTGVTLHRIDEGIDTGDIIAQRSFAIGGEDSCRDLYFRYHDAASVLLREHLASVIDGSFGARPQGEAGASSFPRFLYPFFPKEFRSRQLRLMERGDVHNILRALIFREYQLPLVDGERIARIALADFPERNRIIPTNGGELYALAIDEQPGETS
ncbi:MAG: hypothetical protein JWQ98_899 [Chlorobi bacterium]|nr:hypothetical protein [Chlorobiota bacterium]